MTVEEVVVTKTYNIYISIDGRKFLDKDHCLEYEKWLSENIRNVPTKEQFDNLKPGDKVLYRGKEFIIEWEPNKYDKDIVFISDGGWCDEEVHYTELDLIKIKD